MIMAVNNKKETLHHGESGQAIFELIVFIPFLLYLTSILITLGNSINGAINQQKIVRGYFHGTYRGNPTAPIVRDLMDYQNNGINSSGLVAFGWRGSSLGAAGGSSQSIATCYKLNQMVGSDPNKDDNCEDPSNSEGSTGFIRIYTMYASCGQTYRATDAFYEVDPFDKSMASCSNR